MYLVGLHIYYKMIHGPYNIKIIKFWFSWFKILNRLSDFHEIRYRSPVQSAWVLIKVGLVCHTLEGHKYIFLPELLVFCDPFAWNSVQEMSTWCHLTVTSFVQPILYVRAYMKLRLYFLHFSSELDKIWYRRKRTSGYWFTVRPRKSSQLKPYFAWSLIWISICTSHI